MSVVATTLKELRAEIGRVETTLKNNGFTGVEDMYLTRSDKPVKISLKSHLTLSRLYCEISEEVTSEEKIYNLF